MEARLRAAGCVFAEEEARLLRREAAGPEALEALLRRRLGGEPLEHVLGWAEFCGRRILVDPPVFVPRPRSELLVRLALIGPRPALAVELCCGTAAIATLLHSRWPESEIHAADLDPRAQACARRNLGGNVHLGDLFAALPARLRGRIELLVANAPYVPSAEIERMPPEARDYEPLLALDGGWDGLDLHRRIAAEAGRWLAPGGRLLLETSRHQAETTRTVLEQAGLSVRIEYDEELDATVAVSYVAPAAPEPSAG